MGKGVQGGTAGQACTFQVQCKDTTGENRTTGGDIVVAKLLPPPEKGHVVDCHVIDNADGTYTCTYLPTKALRGVDLMVSVNGTNLAGTPFKASFDAGARCTRAVLPSAASTPARFAEANAGTPSASCAQAAPRRATAARTAGSCTTARRASRSPSTCSRGTPTATRG